MRQIWRQFLAALTFLTVLPAAGETDEETLAASLFYYPLVGLLIGAVAAFAVQQLAGVFPGPLVAVFAVLLPVLFTGAFHLDGLADTADGFFSSRPRQQILAIMRDSRIGVMGVLVLVFTLALKIAALATMPVAGMVAAVLLMPLAGRCAILLMMVLLPYVRADGCAAVFYRKKPTVALTAGLLLLVLVAAGAGAARGMTAAVGAMLFTAFFAWRCRCKIGGATGDTLGAASELAEVGVVLLLAAG